MKWRTLHNRKRVTRRKARAAYYGRIAAFVMLKAWEDGVAMGRYCPLCQKPFDATVPRKLAQYCYQCNYAIQETNRTLVLD